MATKIEWTDTVWNPTTGCNKGVQKWENQLLTPISWINPRRVFVNSMSDLFHEDVPFDFIDKVFAVMALTPQHTYQVLTKRADRMAEYLNIIDINLDWAVQAHELGLKLKRRPVNPLPNVWLGVSVENQEQADKRIPHLLKVPAAVRFLSCEPLLGPLDLTRFKVNDGEAFRNALSGTQIVGPPDFINLDLLLKIHWVIAGGESGPDARPMHPDWVRSLRDQCQAAYVPFFFKQWGEWANGYDVEANGTDWNGMWELDPQDGGAQRFYWPDSEFRKLDEYKGLAPGGVGGDTFVLKVGKKAAGRLLDGVEWNQFPETGGNEGEK